MDELSVYPTKKIPLRQRRSSLSGLEGDNKKRVLLYSGDFLWPKKKTKNHNTNEAETPAGRWRTGETGSGEGAAAGDVMSCYWLTDSQNCRLLRHTPGWGAALIWSSLCEVRMGCCWCTFVRLKDKDGETNVMMGGHEQQCEWVWRVRICRSKQKTFKGVCPRLPACSQLTVNQCVCREGKFFCRQKKKKCYILFHLQQKWSVICFITLRWTFYSNL